MIAIIRFPYIEVLFLIFRYYWGEKCRSFLLICFYLGQIPIPG